jgi:hypothetical protein
VRCKKGVAGKPRKCVKQRPKKHRKSRKHAKSNGRGK